MVATATFTGTTGTITGLLSGIPYYYQITAYNNTTGNQISAVQSHPTAPGTNHQYVMINGQLVLINGQIAEY